MTTGVAERPFSKIDSMTATHTRKWAMGSDLYESDPWDEKLWIERDWRLSTRAAAVALMLVGEGGTAQRSPALSDPAPSRDEHMPDHDALRPESST